MRPRTKCRLGRCSNLTKLTDPAQYTHVCCNSARNNIIVEIREIFRASLNVSHVPDTRERKLRDTEITQTNTSTVLHSQNDGNQRHTLEISQHADTVKEGAHVTNVEHCNAIHCSQDNDIDWLWREVKDACPDRHVQGDRNPHRA